MFSIFDAKPGDIFRAKAGMNLSNVYTKDNLESDYKPGIHLGVYANIPVKGNLFYSPEIMYSQQGYKATYRDFGPSSPVTGKVDINMHYMNILPLSAKLYFGDSRLISVLLGPQLGWLMSARAKGKVDGEAINTKVSNSFKKFNFSAVAGAAADLKSGLNFGCRMNLGFTDVLDLEGLDSSYGKSKNIVFQAHVGYTFINR
jgi:hypothetical protein